MRRKNVPRERPSQAFVSTTAGISLKPHGLRMLLTSKSARRPTGRPRSLYAAGRE